MTLYDTPVAAVRRVWEMAGDRPDPPVTRSPSEPSPPLCAGHAGCVGPRTHARVWSGVIGLDVCESVTHRESAERWVAAMTGERATCERYPAEWPEVSRDGIPARCAAVNDGPIYRCIWLQGHDLPPQGWAHRDCNGNEWLTEATED